MTSKETGLRREKERESKQSDLYGIKLLLILRKPLPEMGKAILYNCKYCLFLLLVIVVEVKIFMN